MVDKAPVNTAHWAEIWLEANRQPSITTPFSCRKVAARPLCPKTAIVPDLVFSSLRMEDRCKRGPQESPCAANLPERREHLQVEPVRRLRTTGLADEKGNPSRVAFFRADTFVKRLKFAPGR